MIGAVLLRRKDDSRLAGIAPWLAGLATAVGVVAFGFIVAESAQ